MKKLMVRIDNDVEALFFDITAVQVVTLPHRFGPSQDKPAVIILKGGANVNLPHDVAAELIKKLHEMSQVIPEATKQ